MIAGGLKSAGIEIDADLRRALANTTSSNRTPNDTANQSFLPSLHQDGGLTPTGVALQNCDTEMDDQSELNIYGQISQDHSPLLLGNQQMRQTEQNFSS